MSDGGTFGPLVGVCLELDAAGAEAGAEGLAAAIEEATVALGCRRLLLHAWAPRGVSAAWALAGGRAVLHTWPERGAATLDAFAPPSAWPAVERALLEAVETLGWTPVRCAAREAPRTPGTARTAPSGGS